MEVWLKQSGSVSWHDLPEPKLGIFWLFLVFVKKNNQENLWDEQDKPDIFFPFPTILTAIASLHSGISTTPFTPTWENLGNCVGWPIGYTTQEFQVGIPSSSADFPNFFIFYALATNKSPLPPHQGFDCFLLFLSGNISACHSHVSATCLGTP